VDPGRRRTLTIVSLPELPRLGFAVRGSPSAKMAQSPRPMAVARLDVYVQPRASRTELAGLHDGRIKVRVAAPAVENAANQALTEFIAERLGLPRRSVRVTAGATSRRKVLEIEGLTAKEIMERLQLTE
jgi:uncharacterized protein